MARVARYGCAQPRRCRDLQRRRRVRRSGRIGYLSSSFHGAFTPQMSATIEPGLPALPATTAALNLLSQPLRNERLIAACRAAFVAASLLALWLDPSEPSRFASLARGLLAIYAVYALLLAAWLARRLTLPRALPTIVHGGDLAQFALLILVTDGATSPFVLAFVFMLAAAALRWQQAGTVWTAAAAIASYVVISLAAAAGLLESEFELNGFIIRLSQLLVVSILIAYLSTSDLHLRRRSALLGQAPASTHADELGQLPALMASTAAALQAPCVVLTWEEADEPLRDIAIWEHGKCGWQHEDPAALGPLLPPGVTGDAAYLSTQGSQRIVDGAGRPLGNTALPGWLQARVGARRSVLSVPVRGQTLQGRLYALDIEHPTADELGLARLLAERIALRLDELERLARFHREGLAAERVRLARDLHDGVIQSLAAAALRLESAKQILDEQPLAASMLIEEIQDLLLFEQRELREFLGAIEPRDADAPPSRPELSERLKALVARIERHWGLKVELVNRLALRELPDGLDQQLHCIVLEALVNASRHGRATTARVQLMLGDGQLQVEIGDDGAGFPFEGTRRFEELQADRSGPASIRNRVATLGGRLDISSDDSGARLAIRLPLRAVEVVA
jgi:signal transduction histidine kinase